MPVHLEITEGPAQGVIIPLSVGKTVRASRPAKTCSPWLAWQIRIRLLIAWVAGASESFQKAGRSTRAKVLRHTHSEPFRANLLVAEEALPTDHDLKKYVDLQVSLGTKNLPAAATPVQVKGAQAAVALTIHANVPKGLALQYQIYAVHSGILGIVTAPALETQPELLRSLLTQLLPGLTFFQG